MKQLLVIFVFFYSNFLEAQNLDAYYTWQFIPSETIKNDPNEQIYYQHTTRKFPFVLSVRNGISVFRPTEFIADQEFIDNEGYKTTVHKGELREYVCHKDFINNRIIINYEYFFKLYTLKDKLTSYEWELENEYKEISGYKCRKATCFDMVGNEVIAWYSEDIPISNGPKEFGGLPGLIVWLSAARTIYAIDKIVFNPQTETVPFSIPKEGEEMTIQEFVNHRGSVQKSNFKSWNK